MIEVLPSNNSELSPLQKNQLYQLMIDAYALTEKEIWGENYSRIGKEEFDELVGSDAVLIAWMDGQIVGSIYYYPLTDNTYGFGLLNADFKLTGRGIGRELIAAAERYAKTAGAAKMKIEILRPRDLVVPFKERLKNWYSALGYKHTETIDFLTYKPHRSEKAKRMVNPSVFDIYVKELS